MTLFHTTSVQVTLLDLCVCVCVCEQVPNHRCAMELTKSATLAFSNPNHLTLYTKWPLHLEPVGHLQPQCRYGGKTKTTGKVYKSYLFVAKTCEIHNVSQTRPSPQRAKKSYKINTFTKRLWSREIMLHFCHIPFLYPGTWTDVHQLDTLQPFPFQLWHVQTTHLVRSEVIPFRRSFHCNILFLRLMDCQWMFKLSIP